MSDRNHFTALDGLRGVAALAVAVLHATDPFEIRLLPNAGLAVDFFFLLSGFVVAYAYEDRLRSGALTYARFLRLRVERLHPLIVAGVLAGAVVYGANYVLEGGPATNVAVAALFGVLLIPFNGLYPQSYAAQPLNPPGWSLFAEYLANFVYGAIGPRLTNPVLALLLVGGLGLEVAIVVINGGLDVGVLYSDWLLGAARVVFPFVAGIAIHRIWAAGKLPRLALPFPVLGVLLMLTLVAPLPGWFDLIAVVFLFPLIIVTGIHDVSTGAGARLADLAGRLSYPLYITHYVQVWIFSTIARRLDLNGAALAMLIVVEVLVMLVVAFLALKLYDEPVRRYLANRRRRAS